ncbi:hypothetical protein [Jannaschia formosa]|uniref:hypothetical protein n=1 Tax=Jannaschia formosa TaxID=2259592 RepID=UPI00143061FC|nr:hypothetical protein [Jannaschia formosa]
MTTPKTPPRTDRPGKPREVPADSPVGTTHDPNSVTTGTEVEPDDRFPPKTRK